MNYLKPRVTKWRDTLESWNTDWGAKCLVYLVISFNIEDSSARYYWPNFMDKEKVIQKDEVNCVLPWWNSGLTQLRVHALLDGKLVQTCLSLLKSDLSCNLLHYLLFFHPSQCTYFVLCLSLRSVALGLWFSVLAALLALPGMGSGVSIF